MTKIEQTLALAVVAIKARRVQVSDPTQLSALPSNAELDDLREWVTAALPVVEAVRKWQPRRRAFDWAVEAQPRPENYMTIAREFQEAQNKMLDLLADAVLPENEP